MLIQYKTRKQYFVHTLNIHYIYSNNWNLSLTLLGRLTENVLFLSLNTHKLLLDLTFSCYTNCTERNIILWLLHRNHWFIPLNLAADSKNHICVTFLLLISLDCTSKKIVLVDQISDFSILRASMCDFTTRWR